jgi:copper homeostasis protein
MALQLEICIEAPAAGVAAREGGADRVELCSALSVGGLTPSHGLIAETVAQCGLPVHVLVRPRAGNFVYSSEELRMIERDIEAAKQLGAAGVVLGVLDAASEVDAERTRAWVAQAAPMAVTFHRAIDRSRNLGESLERVIEAGCARVLSSGGQPTVAEGASMLASLAQQAAGRIRIAAGGGVTLESARQLLQTASVDLHASLRRHAAAVVQSTDPLWNAEHPCAVDPADVRALVKLMAQAAH